MRTNIRSEIDRLLERKKSPGLLGQKNENRCVGEDSKGEEIYSILNAAKEKFEKTDLPMQCAKLLKEDLTAHSGKRRKAKMTYAVKREKIKEI